MTPEDRLVCLCVREKFDLETHQKVISICQNNDIQWDEVYTSAEQNHVSPLVHINLASLQHPDLKIPQEILDRFKKDYIRNVVVKKRMSAILKEVLALFNQKNIDVMLIKGGALNLFVYDQPWYTVSYDVDLVIRSSRDAIEESDHREIIDVIEAYNHQSNEFKEHIEYDFYAHHDMTMNNVLPIDSDRIWAEARKVQAYESDVYIMTREDMLIAAAINSCRKRFFSLKALLDIATLIEKYPDLDWDTLIEKARAYECNTILYTALKVTETTLGSQLPPGLLDNLRVNPIRASMVSHLLNSLYRRMPLSKLFSRSSTDLLGRGFSWSLLLTYATYRMSHLWRKFSEFYAAWRNPPPPVPG